VSSIIVAIRHIADTSLAGRRSPSPPKFAKQILEEQLSG